MSTEILTAERLRELLHYDPLTGLFTWRAHRSSRATAGQEAGTLTVYGYRRIRLGDRPWMAHRLAWLYVHGTQPVMDIDHINRNRSDNRLSNLRESSRSENLQNSSLRKTSSSGHKGVHFYKATGRWQVHLAVEGRAISLGYYLNLEEAIAARKAAELKYHPFAATSP